ncbi:hypothetical protein [Streptomyces sp. NPDC048636]|uniref:hypothetical protein n=1 Tax=Streptomyces sp. NPDC048636 TaxID=3155762 RepID=UPI0034421DA1
MRRQEPPNVTLGPMAPHIPADLYRQAEGQPFVIVQTTAAPRRPARAYVMPIAVGLAGAFGVMGTVAAALALFEFAARTAALIGSAAGPVGVGLSIKLFHPKTKK